MPENKKEKSGNRGLLIVICILLLVILGLIAFIFLGRKPSVSNVPGPGTNLEIETGVEDTEKKKETKAGSAPNIVMPGWGTITVKADSTEIDVPFKNPDANEGYYYMTFALMIENGEAEGGYETLYQSGLVEPGKFLNTITLSRPIPPGTYEAIVHIQPYTMDDSRTATNNGNVKIKLIAE